MRDASEWWLQEHLRSNYTPGWTTLVRDNKTDAAIGDVGASRWSNYYVEGMSNLACEATQIDGVELDGLAFPRHTMARLRKVTEACRGNQTIINTHSGDDFHSKSQPQVASLKLPTRLRSLLTDGLLDCAEPAADGGPRVSSVVN